MRIYTVCKTEGGISDEQCRLAYFTAVLTTTPVASSCSSPSSSYSITSATYSIATTTSATQ